MVHETELIWITNATFSLSRGETKIIFDPWGSETASYGSWYHYPPLSEDTKSLIFKEKYDAIFISHHHTDHFDHRTINLIMAQNQKTKVFFSDACSTILSHPIKVLKERFGADRVIIAVDSEPIKVGSFELRYFRSDFCDPQICGAVIGCLKPNFRTRSIDSFIVIDVEGTRIINFNDSLIRLIQPSIKEIIDDADVVMGLFGGAGPYPQSFPELREKRELGINLAQKFIDDLILISTTLKAKYIFPFSGQYVLGGKLTHLNRYRAMIPITEAHKKINDFFKGEKYSVDVNLGKKWFIPDQLSKSCISKQPLVEERYIEMSKNDLSSYLEKISNEKFPYEKFDYSRITRHRMIKLLRKSTERYNKAVTEAQVSDSHSILIEPQGKDYIWEIDSQASTPGMLRELNYKPSKGAYTLIKIDERLLFTTINRKIGFNGYTTAHWTNIHGGSHLEFYQNGYSSAALYFLNFFHV